MGNSCRLKKKPIDPVKEILSKRCSDITIILSTEKSEFFLKKTVCDVKVAILEKIKNLRFRTLQLIEDEQSKMNQNLNQTLGKIEKQTPGTLRKLEMRHKKSVRDFLQFQRVDEQFVFLKKQINQRLNAEKKYIIDDIEKHNAFFENKLGGQKPVVCEISKLKEQQQKRVFLEGSKLFQASIAEMQKTTNSEISQKIKIQTYDNRFNDLFSQVKLQRAKSTSQSILNSVESMIVVKNLFC